MKKQRTKIASCRLRLQSMNGEILLKNLEDSPRNDWRTDNECLVKDNYFMRDNVEYVETLNISNFIASLMIFKLEFEFEMIDSRKYMMTSVFSVEMESRPDREKNSPAVMLKNHSDLITERLTEVNHRVFNTPQNIMFTKYLCGETHDI